jgi:hypothetical protein
MTDYVKPTMKYKPDMIILHCGTNDFKDNEESENVANRIVKLAMDLSNDTEVAVSSLLVRCDRYSDRVSKVNSFLRIKCSDRNLQFIDHSNTIVAKHLNRSRIHLNKDGSRLFAQSLRENITN